MKGKSRLIKAMCIGITAAMLFTGCAADTASETAEVSASQSAAATESAQASASPIASDQNDSADSEIKTVSGRIEEIQDDVITMSVRGGRGGDMGELPAKLDGDSMSEFSAKPDNESTEDADASSKGGSKNRGDNAQGSGDIEQMNDSSTAPDNQNTADAYSSQKGNGKNKTDGSAEDADVSGDADSSTKAKPSGDIDSMSGASEDADGTQNGSKKSKNKNSDTADSADGSGRRAGTSDQITINSDTVIKDAQGSEISASELKAGDYIKAEINGDGVALRIEISEQKAPQGKPGGSGAPGSNAPAEYKAVYDYSENGELSNVEITSEGKDENAVLVRDGANVSLDNVTIDRVSSDSTGGDNASFYGVGAAALATDGELDIANSEINTDSQGGAGVFAYADGVVNVSDTTIKTQKNASGGIHAAGGGTVNAANLTVETQGEQSAAIRSDRGGGTITVDGGSYTSNGEGSPAVYSTADITIKNAELTANGSEAACIEGLNSITLENCTLEGNMKDLSQNDCTWTVILYQSMSGDSEIGNSTFTMNGGKLVSGNGGLFYTTNTESSFNLNGVDIETSKDCEFFLKCTGNENQRGWGERGANGADCDFKAENQEMNGDVIWDKISMLDFEMSEGSVLTGAFLTDEKNPMGDGYANLTIDSSSKWVVTEDSVLSDLTCKGEIVDESGKAVKIVGADGNVLRDGDSGITVTVDTYSE